MFPAAHKGIGHTVEKPRGQTSAPEGGVAENIRYHARLRHQQDRQCRVHNALALSSDAVDADGIARIAFQHDVNVDVLGVYAGEGVKDTAFAGNQRRSALIGGNDRYQLFRGDVIDIQLQRLFLPEIRHFLRDPLHLLRTCLSLCHLFLKGFLPALQHALLHLAALETPGVLPVVIYLIFIDGFQHKVLHGGLSFGRRRYGKHIGVERL